MSPNIEIIGTYL